MNFKILGFNDKIPKIASIVLTTYRELKKVKIDGDQVDVIPYYPNENIKKYTFKVLAAYRLGYRGYKDLIFSIDPGLNHIGIVIFLDDFYINSHTLNDYEKLLKLIDLYQQAIQEDNLNPLFLTIKLGRGLYETTANLIIQIFKVFKGNLIKLLLIDEKNSSKIRISHMGKRFPKHESSALILAFRDGLELSPSNYETVFSQIKNSNGYSFPNQDKEQKKKLSDIAEKVILGELSLSQSLELIKSKIE